MTNNLEITDRPLAQVPPEAEATLDFTLVPKTAEEIAHAREALKPKPRKSSVGSVKFAGRSKPVSSTSTRPRKISIWPLRPG